MKNNNDERSEMIKNKQKVMYFFGWVFLILGIISLLIFYIEYIEDINLIVFIGDTILNLERMGWLLIIVGVLSLIVGKYLK